MMGFNAIAQNERDRLYVASVDSILSCKLKRHLSFEYKSFYDTLNFRKVKIAFDGGILATIWVKSLGCEEIIFHIANDSLFCVEYQLSDPDNRGSLPPVTNYIIYFKNNQQVHYSVTSNWGGSKTCHSYSINDKSFLKDYYYYKSFCCPKNE